MAAKWPVCLGADPGRVDRVSARGVGVLPQDVMVLRVEGGTEVSAEAEAAEDGDFPASAR